MTPILGCSKLRNASVHDVDSPLEGVERAWWM
jgi:hypothetical protein